MPIDPAAPVGVTQTVIAPALSISKMFLPDSQQFNTKNLNAFIETFKLLCSTLSLDYLIEDHVIEPATAVRARDNSILFRVLHGNVCTEAQAIVIEKRGEGGIAAWKHLLAFYGKKDVGTTIAKFKEYMACTFEGGSAEDFQAFLTRKSTLRSDLIQRNFKITDSEYAAHLIAAVPIAYIPLNGTVNLSSIDTLKSVKQ